MLATEIILDTQELGVFPGTTFFEGGFSCVCIDEGESVSCDFEPGTPGKLLCGQESYSSYDTVCLVPLGGASAKAREVDATINVKTTAIKRDVNSVLFLVQCSLTKQKFE